jgi:hypothetical protein
MKDPQMTFIVRIWADETTGAPAWRGEAEQVGTGRLHAFQTMEELVEWMRLVVDQLEETQHNGFVQGGSEYRENYGAGTNG